MARFQADSSDDEIGVNLQLAERLSINKNNRASNRTAMNEKDLKQLRNHYRQRNIIEDQSSSSSSLDMHNDLTVSGPSSGYGFHNKKRQNGDKILDLFANPKRTCLGGDVYKGHRLPESRKASDISEGVRFSQTSSKRNLLYPDNTYEDHLNNTSNNEDSDLDSTAHFPMKSNRTVQDNSATHRKCAPPIVQNPISAFENNRASENHNVHFVDSTSDDDSRTMMQNGALKGGRQSPEPICHKKVVGRKIKKILDSDTDDDWQVGYRSRPLIFTSSDSDDAQSGIKRNKKKSNFVSKKTANLPFPSGSALTPDDHTYHRSTHPPLHDCSNSSSNPSFTPLDLQPKNTSIKSHPGRTSRKNSSLEWKKLYNADESLQGGGDMSNSERHSRNPGTSQLTNLRRHRHLAAANSFKGRGGPSSEFPMDVDKLRSDLYNGEGNSGQCCSIQQAVSLLTNTPYRPEPRTAHQRPFRSCRNNVRSPDARALNGSSGQNGKSLTNLFPDLFEAESSSDVEFFTANSYSDNERKIEPVSFRSRRPVVQNQPVQNLIENSVNVGSSEDEISVVFSSAPRTEGIERRAGSSKTLGRRYSRRSRRVSDSPLRVPNLSNSQEVVSLSPDPVEQVRQVEEDERFARMLQAQFDSEVNPAPLDPTPLLSIHTPPHSIDTDYIGQISSGDDDSDEFDLPFDDADFVRHATTFTGNQGFLESRTFVNGSTSPRVSVTVRDRSNPAFRVSSFSSTTTRGRRRDRLLEQAIASHQAIARPYRLGGLGMFPPMTAPFIPHDLVGAIDDSYEAFLNLVDMNGDVTRGLQKTEINRLPTRKYIVPNSSTSNAAEMPHKRAELNKECQVCLNDYVNGDVLRILPCFHEFHTPCIDPWLKINHTCPVCRVVVDLEE